MQNAVGSTERTSNNTNKKKKKKSAHTMAPMALQQYDISSPQRKKRSVMPWRWEVTVLLKDFSRYYWMRQRKKVWRDLTGRQVLFNKAIYRANCSMFPDRIDTSSHCNKRLWTPRTRVHTAHRAMDLSPHMWPLSVSTGSGDVHFYEELSYKRKLLVELVFTFSRWLPICTSAFSEMNNRGH